MELIDKQELLDWIQNCWDWATVDGITSTTVLKQTMTDISQLPTVEAIPKADYENRLKAEKVAMLEDLKKEMNPIKECEQQIYGKECWNFVRKCQVVIQQKISDLKGEDQ